MFGKRKCYCMNNNYQNNSCEEQNDIMEDKSVDSHIMEVCKAALVQVALDAAKGIGKTPSEQNGFLPVHRKAA